MQKSITNNQLVKTKSHNNWIIIILLTNKQINFMLRPLIVSNTKTPFKSIKPWTGVCWRHLGRDSLGICSSIKLAPFLSQHVWLSHKRSPLSYRFKMTKIKNAKSRQFGNFVEACKSQNIYSSREEIEITWLVQSFCKLILFERN